MDHINGKTRSAGQILEEFFVHHRGHIFSPELLNDGQNVCLYDTLDKFLKRKGPCLVKN